MKGKLPHNGFTLIELMVVMAIIGILLALAVIGLQAAQSSSRDNARKNLASEVDQNLISYQNAHGDFPDPSTQFICTSSGNGCFITYPGICQNTQIQMGSNCFDLFGLKLNTAHPYTSCGFSAPDSRYVTFCYTNSTGTQGYTLGTFLESGTTFYEAQ